MKSLSESLFDKDLVEKSVDDAYFQPLRDFLKKDILYTLRGEFLKYLMVKNPKTPKNCYFHSAWDTFSSTKDIRDISKTFKELFIEHQTSNPMSVVIINRLSAFDMYRGSDTPVEDIADDIMELCKSNINVCRIKSLPKTWVNKINDYNKYFNWPKINTKCDDYLCVTDDYNIYIIGFPKGTPSYILNVFEMK